MQGFESVKTPAVDSLAASSLPRRSRRTLSLTALATAVVTSSCGGGADSSLPTVDEGPAYLVGTRVWDDSSTTSYFHLVSSIEAGTALDSTQALEVSGSARLYSVPNLGWFALGRGEEPTITRYLLDEHGALSPGESISLVGYGVDSLWDTLYFVSPTKAYYPDRAGTQLIVWNPTDMTLTGSIPLPETARSSYLALYGYAPILRGSTLLVSVGWFDWDNDTVLGETGVVRIDTITDTVTGFETDTRCGGVTQPVTLASGDTYLASSALAGAAFKLGRSPTEPCVLRVRAGEESLDANYVQPLFEVSGGALAGEPIPAGGKGLFLRVFDDELAEVSGENLSWEVTGQAAWRWARWTPGEASLELVDGLEPATADVAWFEVDGRVFGAQTTESYEETTLVELTADGGPRPALTAPGFLHGVARIR
jgi:hypothetical protein